MEADKVPSDVVELIIAVDLNPTDPEEPLNVSSVDVRDKGEGGEGGEDWKKLTMQLLMGDPAAGVTSDSISYDEAVEATARALGEGGREEKKEDPFTRSQKPKGRPEFGKRDDGMEKALDRTLGRGKPFGKDEDEDEDEEKRPWR